MSIKKISNTDIDDSTKLMLHCDGADESTSFPDASPSQHTVTAHADAQVDTAQKKFGTGSALFDGTGDYLSVPDSADWDIPVGDWTLDFQIKFASHSSIEVLFLQYEDAGNYWRLYHNDGLGFNFVVFTDSVSRISMNGGGEITDNNWHHVAICRVGNNYGIYVDGNQVNYDSNATGTSFNAQLLIGTKQSFIQLFNGHMDEIRIRKANCFDASPVVGLTDTITVPTSAHSVISIEEILNTSASDISKISGVTK